MKQLMQVIRSTSEELTKTVDYEYDLVSGKVNKVYYQKAQADQFIHTYNYDGDNRITKVETSTDDIIYTQEATYQYYAHGPLARTKLGEDGRVETQDYAYTIQGWIKQVQGNAFGYALGYNGTDYSPIGTSTVAAIATPIETGKDLYNGNIATMTSKTKDIDGGNPWTQQYTYDQLNRIKTSATPGSSQYATAYSYDANGNILSLSRKDDAGNTFDELSYIYETKANGYQKNTNKLRSVNDAAASSLTTSDIDNQSNDNYTYDAIGNLISDRSEEIENIEWSVSGKVLSVMRSTGSTKPNLEFSYDASGQRVCKKVIIPNGTITSTYYVRDASGNVMSVYRATNTQTASVKEQYIYGSSRIGVYNAALNTTSNARTLGLRHYELTDHLGNVRVVLSDYKQEIITASDYYPFGMELEGRRVLGKDKYRYGFNGKEKDDENFEGAYDFGARILDVRLGRWLAVDVLFFKYSGISPYCHSFDNPIYYIDPNGKEPITPTSSNWVNSFDNITNLVNNGIEGKEDPNRNCNMCCLNSLASNMLTLFGLPENTPISVNDRMSTTVKSFNSRRYTKMNNVAPTYDGKRLSTRSHSEIDGTTIDRNKINTNITNTIVSLTSENGIGVFALGIGAEYHSTMVVVIKDPSKTIVIDNVTYSGTNENPLILFVEDSYGAKAFTTTTFETEMQGWTLGAWKFYRGEKTVSGANANANSSNDLSIDATLFQLNVDITPASNQNNGVNNNNVNTDNIQQDSIPNVNPAPPTLIE